LPASIDARNKSLNISNGTVTFLANGGEHFYRIDQYIDPEVNIGDISISDGQLNLGAVSDGRLTLESKGNFVLGNNAILDVGFGARVFGPSMQLSGFGTSPSAFNEIRIKGGGEVHPDTLSVGHFSNSQISIEGHASVLTAHDIVVGSEQSNATVFVTNGGKLVSTGQTSIGEHVTGNGVIWLEGKTGAATWDANSISIGGTGFKSEGSGLLLANRNSVVDSDSITVWSQGLVQVYGGTLTTADLDLNGGTLLLASPEESQEVSVINVTNPSSELRLTADSIPSGILTLDARAKLNVAGATLIAPGTSIDVSDTTAFRSSKVANNGKITVHNTPLLEIGDSSRYGAYSGTGELHLSQAGVTLNDAGYADLGLLTSLNRGSIVVPNGLFLPGGGDLVSVDGPNYVVGKITTGAGSTIQVEGRSFLSLGDRYSSVGVSIGGELHVHDGFVSLNDANMVKLGPLTTLGRGGLAGTLMVENGALIENGSSIVGFGSISSIDELLTPIIVNGQAVGNGWEEPLYFGGLVTGSGTFDNVVFHGTHSPSHGIASINVGNIAYSESSTLKLELGGTEQAVEFEQIVSSGTIQLLGGKLEITPSSLGALKLGQSLEILRADVAILGNFGSLSYSSLDDGLALTLTYSDHVVTLHVVQRLEGDFNGNGVVDAADFTVWRDGLGSSYQLSEYLTWKSQFAGDPSSSASITLSSLPEASSRLLLMVVLVVLAFQRDRYLAKRVAAATFAGNEHSKGVMHHPK